MAPRVSYTHTEIQDFSSGLLHPHRNSGSLLGSLTPTQKFGITPRVSFTHTEIWDHPPGLLHPHRNLGSLPGSLTPSQKFGITPRVSYTHTEIWDHSRVSYTLIEIQDHSPGLLHPHRNSGSLPGSLTPTHDLSPKEIYGSLLSLPQHTLIFFFSSFDVVPKINSTHTHQEW